LPACSSQALITTNSNNLKNPRFREGKLNKLKEPHLHEGWLNELNEFNEFNIPDNFSLVNAFILTYKKFLSPAMTGK
jgi:hypothetical protein